MLFLASVNVIAGRLSKVITQCQFFQQGGWNIQQFYKVYDKD